MSVELREAMREAAGSPTRAFDVDAAVREARRRRRRAWAGGAVTATAAVAGAVVVIAGGGPGALLIDSSPRPTAGQDVPRTAPAPAQRTLTLEASGLEVVVEAQTEARLLAWQAAADGVELRWRDIDLVRSDSVDTEPLERLEAMVAEVADQVVLDTPPLALDLSPDELYDLRRHPRDMGTAGVDYFVNEPALAAAIERAPDHAEASYEGDESYPEHVTLSMTGELSEERDERAVFTFDYDDPGLASEEVLDVPSGTLSARVLGPELMERTIEAYVRQIDGFAAPGDPSTPGREDSRFEGAAEGWPEQTEFVHVTDRGDGSGVHSMFQIIVAIDDTLLMVSGGTEQTRPVLHSWALEVAHAIVEARPRRAP